MSFRNTFRARSPRPPVTTRITSLTNDTLKKLKKNELLHGFLPTRVWRLQIVLDRFHTLRHDQHNLRNVFLCFKCFKLSQHICESGVTANMKIYVHKLMRVIKNSGRGLVSLLLFRSSFHRLRVERKALRARSNKEKQIGKCGPTRRIKLKALLAAGSVLRKHFPQYTAWITY